MTAVAQGLDALRRGSGLVRSLAVYHGSRRRLRRMEGLFAPFVRPGDIAFDIGAHVGDRTAVLRRLGARVVAVEPQADCVSALRMIFGRDIGVTVVPAAVAATPGALTLRLNRANPTVSTASEEFIAAANGAPGWEGQRWDGTTRVSATTLDALIAAHGRPKFIKIDVEGFEAEALAGLSAPVAVVAFEFLMIRRNAVDACLNRLAMLGDWRFNYSVGESQTLALAHPVKADALRAAIAALPDAANSGDIFAFHQIQVG